MYHYTYLNVPREHTHIFTMLSQIGQTSLHIAAGCGNYEIVKLLVNANSDVNATPKVYYEHQLIHYTVVGPQETHVFVQRIFCTTSKNPFVMNSC